MAFEKRSYKGNWGNMALHTHATPINKKPATGGDEGDSYDDSVFGDASDMPSMDDPDLIFVGIATLREHGYLLVHNVGSGTDEDGGRKNFYMVGEVDDPWAQANSLANMPDFIRVAYKPHGNKKAIFHFYQKSVTGEWRGLHSTPPMDINLG